MASIGRLVLRHTKATPTLPPRTPTRWLSTSSGATSTTPPLPHLEMPNWLLDAPKEHLDVYVMGHNPTRLFGADTGAPIITPKKVQLARGVRSVSFGHHHMAYITPEGHVMTMGDGVFGVLGNGGTNPVRLPLHVPFLPPCKQVACGKRHTLAVSEDGELFSWGFGGGIFMGAGWLGNGSYNNQPVARRVEALSGVKIKHVACGVAHSLAVTEDGRLYAFGCGKLGRLGLGSSRDVLFPKRVHFPHPNVFVSHAYAGAAHSVIVDDCGRLWAFGRNHLRQTGIKGRGYAVFGTSRVTTPEPLDSEFSFAATGFNNTVVASNDYAESYGGHGMPLRLQVERALDGHNIVGVAAANSAGLLVTDDGRALSFGLASSACLGYNTLLWQPSARAIPGFGPDGELGKVLGAVGGPYNMALFVEPPAEKDSSTSTSTSTSTTSTSTPSSSQSTSAADTESQDAGKS